MSDPAENRPPSPIEAVFADRAVRREGGTERVPGPRARRTRQRILAAAMQCFVADGYSRTSMADVADAAGISLGAVYQYFRDRSDLVGALVREGLRVMLTRVDAEWRVGEGVGGLERVLTNFAASYADAPGLVAVWEETSQTEADLADLRRSLGRVFERAVARELRRAQQAGEVAADLEPADTARALTAMVDRYCYVTYVFDPPEGGPPPAEETGVLLARLWARAIGIGGAPTGPREEGGVSRRNGRSPVA
ncbi:MAG TPA: TetR/AcrR family transcriptional regulator [Acidimicrobiales bacterium]|nr:TetR/AcrR family transcriptional regulator [Acidimicrobiales bacterium]